MPRPWPRRSRTTRAPSRRSARRGSRSTPRSATFAKDTLIASTAALASESAGDATYTSLENQILSLGASRDQLASQIRLALNNAEFNGQKIKDKTARAWTDQANALLAAAHALAASAS